MALTGQLEVPLDPATHLATLFIATLSISGLGIWAIATLWTRLQGKFLSAGNTLSHTRAMREDAMRLRLGSQQSVLALIGLILLAIAIADTISFALSAIWLGRMITFVSPLVATALPVMRWLIRALAALEEKGKCHAPGRSRMSHLVPLLIWLIALLFVVAALALWGGFAQLIAVRNHAGQLVWQTSGLGYPGRKADAVLFIIAASATRGFVNYIRRSSPRTVLS